MPIYEYQCGKCANRFEKIHGASEKDPKVVCPKCGEGNPRRVLSPFSCGNSRGNEAGTGSGCVPSPGRFS